MGVPPIDETRPTLLTAWKAWDNAPSHPHEAAQAEIAFGNHATHLNLRTTQLRDLAQAWRRAGYTREQSLTAIEAGIGAIQ